MTRTIHGAALALACAAIIAILSHAAAGQTGGGLGPTNASDGNTLPSSETVRGVVMNNWADSVAIHYARQLYQADQEHFGPYLAALHGAVDWTMNQIDGATAFFGTEVLDGTGASAGGRPATGPERPSVLCEASGEVKGDDLAADPQVRQSYPTAMCFDDGGILRVEYLRETERGLPIQIEKAYAMVPNQRFLVVRYTVTNNIPREDNTRVRVRVTEVVDLNNKTSALDHEEAQDRLVDTGLHAAQPGQPIDEMQARWHPDVNAWIADMSAANGTFLVFGALQEMERHRAFQTVSDQLAFDWAVAPEMGTVDQRDPPQNVDELTGMDLGLALWDQVDLDPAGTQQYAFFYGVTSSLDEARQIAAQVREPMQAADHWFDRTRSAYDDWLKKGRRLERGDAGVVKAFTRALITTKQSQQPQFGSFVAATNPAYGFKVWPRDSSVTALGLTAAGHLDDAVKFYRWMSSVQEDGSRQMFPRGTWFSNYSYWVRKRPKQFVEPEWDSLGLFTVGVYHTWRIMHGQDPEAARRFLTDPIERLDQGPTSVYDAVTRAADFIANSINEHGYGPADHSIWEEDFQWNTFTQVTYASGLNAARLLAQDMGESERVSRWRGGAQRVLDAIHRPASARPCPGLWNDAASRWNRATFPDCRSDSRLDASSNLVWVFGLVDAADQRATSQRDDTLATLNPGNDGVGIGRYEGDEFYHANPFSPGGTFEASASLPSWPQMDMYLAMLEHWRGLDDIAFRRLQWYARVTNVGYMPPGEAVDWPTDRPLPSTASEPVTGAWYILGLLNFLNAFDPRLPPIASADDRVLSSAGR
jgi:hypothetical protein